MANSTNLQLPYLSAAQAQKHVTVNQALAILDALVQLSVVSRSLTAPPGSPNDGDRYIPASGATGAWAGWDLNVVAYTDGIWVKLVPREGWRVWVSDEDSLLVYDGTAWRPLAEALGLIQLGGSTVVSEEAAGSRNSLVVEEELLSGLSGATVDSTIVIPDRAIVFGVSTRTVATVTGATSYDCGIDSEPSKFGGLLSVSAGSTNAGVIGPQAFYADTPIRLTANGSNFTGGAVRIAIHYFMPRVPQS